MSPGGPERRVRPLPQLCLGKCPVWVWSGGSLRWAGMKKAEGALFPPRSLGVTAAPSLIPRGAERWLKKSAAMAHPWTGHLRAPESCLSPSPETSLLASFLTPRPWLPPATADAPSQAGLRSPARAGGKGIAQTSQALPFRRPCQVEAWPLGGDGSSQGWGPEHGGEEFCI